MTLSIAHLYPLGSTSVVLSLRGSLDGAAAPDLRTAITVEAGRVPRPGSIVVDLTGVDHVDGAGVSTLMVGNRLCAVLGVNLAVRGPSPLIRNLLDLTDRGRLPAASDADRAHQRPRCGTARGSTGTGIRRRAAPRGVVAPPARPPTHTRPSRGR